MLANIQAVVFDLDGTLLDRHRSFEPFVRDQWERFGYFVRTVDQEKNVQILIDPRGSRVVEADAVIEELGDLVSLPGLERSGYSN